VFAIVQSALYQIYQLGYPDGLYAGTGLTLNIAGIDVVVRGNMTDGVFTISTMFVSGQ